MCLQSNMGSSRSSVVHGCCASAEICAVTGLGWVDTLMLRMLQ